MKSSYITTGTAGWTIPKNVTDRFPPDGTALERYARVFDCVEINSTFRNEHRATTYERWARSVPEGFRFHLKVPQEITHKRKLDDCAAPLDAFLAQTNVLGARRGTLLVQLPPKLAYDRVLVEGFFRLFRSRYDGPLACEPRHPSWFTGVADELLTELHVARVAADPAVVPQAARPGGWDGFAYVRWHGAPRVYYSTYDDATIERFAAEIAALEMPATCIFDNTALGGAAGNAFLFQARAAAARREKNKHATSKRQR